MDYCHLQPVPINGDQMRNFWQHLTICRRKPQTAAFASLGLNRKIICGYLTLFTLANIAWKEMYSSVRFFFFVVLVRTSPTPVNNTAHEHITYSHSRIDTLRITTLTNVQRAPCLECFIDIHICVFVHSWVKCRKFVSHSEFSLLYTNFSTSGNCEVEKKIKQPQQQQFTAERIKWAPTAAGSRWRSTTSAPFAVFVLG